MTAERPRGGTWTVRELLLAAKTHFAERGIATPRLDAECLLAFALGADRLALYLEFDRPVSPAERATFRELARRRAAERVPVAQLTGAKEFWSLPLRVTPDVLTPRPDTETLVAAALEAFPDRDAELRVLDVGTGCGAVALALARERPKVRVTATDVSPAALAVAGENARALGLADRVELLAGSLFEPVAGREFDAIVSNPPYLAEGERETLEPELRHEPEGALFAGPDGLAFLGELAAGAPERLAPGGFAAFELAPAQAGRVADWCRAAGLLDVTEHRDLAGRVRVVAGRKPGGSAGGAWIAS